MNSPAAQPLNVFISYSHKDETLKEELETHLTSLVRQGKIQPWQDRDIEAGTRWDDEIKGAMVAADIILLLVSPSFMASQYIHEHELSHAVERDRAGTARVIPVILRPTDFTGTIVADLQAVPKNALPITRWDDQDEAFLDVVKSIRRVVDTLSQRRQETGAVTAVASVTSPATTAPVTVTPATGQKPAPQSSTQQRLALFQLLSGLPGPMFDSVVYALNVPPALMPPPVAPQGQRVPALLNWAQSPVGCGLEELEVILQQVVKT